MSETQAEVGQLHQIKATSVDHVVLWVKDIERSKRFYMDLLGMTVAHEHLGPDAGETDPLDADFRCFLSIGSDQVGLFERKDNDVEGRERLNHFALNIETGSRAEVRALLEAHGVEVIGRANDPGCVYASDPDGHLVQLLTPLED